MPDAAAQTTFHTDAVDWGDIGDMLTTGALKALGNSSVQKAIISTLSEKEGAMMAMLFDLLEDVAFKAGEGLHALERPFMPVIAAFVAPIVAGLFGAEVDERAFAQRLARGGGHNAARAIVDGFLKAIEGDGAGGIEPSPNGSARVASAAVAASLEATFNALVPELLSDLLPFDIGHFKELTELPEGIIRALGVGRLVRRAVGPLVTVCAATPMEWHVHKKYRPTLLSPGDVVRQVLRGHWSKAEALEELARLGYSDRRIEALFNAGQKFFGVADVRTFESRLEWTNEQALQHLKDQGYDDQTARDALRLEGLKRFDQLETQEATALIGAYAARDIDRGTFVSMLDAAVSVPSERALFTELAEIRRAVNIKRLTIGQVEAMVKSGVANFRDYRDAAAAEGYSDDAVTLLELQLRWEINREKGIEQHRAELETERAALKAERDAAIVARRAQVEQERALTRRGAESDLERAVVRGQISIARLEEVYTARYDSDTVAILVALVEDDRLAYLAQQDARAGVLKGAARRNIDVGALEQAFTANLLTATELYARLVTLGFSAADADLLTATAFARKADLDAAKTKRDAAVKTATARSIDLGRFERLVRRGARTIPQYVQLLESLGVDEASRAAFVDLLQLEIADDTAARELRAQAAAAPPLKGLTLEQIRRAVLLGVQTVDDFQRFLVANRYTSDAQAVLLAELRADVAEAEAARQRRASAASAPATPETPLSTIRRAAQLGVVSPDVYLERLVRAGYSDDDVALELELLLVEIADVQAARRRREATAPAPAATGLSLPALERAVKAGVSTLEEYRARAITLGYSLDDVEILTAVLDRELQTLSAARAAHDNLALRLATDGLSLAALDAQAKSGALSLVDYVAQLEGWGVEGDEAQLVAAFAAWQVEQASATGG